MVPLFPTHLVVFEEGPELLQSIEGAIVVILKSLLLEVFKDVLSEFLLQTVAIEPEETLQSIPIPLPSVL